jgi:hypothetical protein
LTKRSPEVNLLKGSFLKVIESSQSGFPVRGQAGWISDPIAIEFNPCPVIDWLIALLI